MNDSLPIWNLKDLYTSLKSKEISKDIKTAQNKTNLFVKRNSTKVHLMDGKKLSKEIKAYEDICLIIGKLYSFASLSFSVNSEKPEFGQLYQKIKELSSEIFSNLIFFELEIMNLNKTVSSRLIKDKDLSYWKPWLRKIFYRKPYQLSSELEKFIAENKPNTRGAWVRLFDETSASLRFNYNGKLITETNILNLLSDKNSNIRKKAAKEFSRVLNENIKTRSLIINTISRDKSVEDKKRGFLKPISSRNLDNDVEDQVVKALATSVTNRFSDLSHRYYQIKSSWFKKPALNWWDRNAPLPNSPTDKWSWQEAKEIVLTSFEDFSPEISKIAKLFFDKNWIDAKIRSGKDSGAYSHPTVPNVHPYILMNYSGKSRDVMTLAHELGHGVHQTLSARNGYFLSDTPLTLAETASVFGEMLVFQNLLAKSKNKNSKKHLIAGKVEDMLNTVVRQIAFHNFETQFHDARKNNELTPKQISQIWMETQSQALGKYIVLDKSYEPLWSYIPHFIHTPFYVYAYAFGDCLVNSLFQVWKNGEKDFTYKYLNLLKSGGIHHHKQALSPFNLDASDKRFWNKGLNTISDLIDELENL